MSIAFNQIGPSWRIPGVESEIDSSQANTTTGVQPFRALLIGQKRSVGTQPVLTPTRVTSAKGAEALFGAGSMLALMCASFLSAGSAMEMWAVAVTEPAGAPASSTTTFAVSSPTAGTLKFLVHGRPIQVAVSSTSTAADLATAFASAIQSDPTLHVSAAAVGAVVTATAKNAGTYGNDLDIRLNHYDGESTPSGVTVTLNAFAGGTTDPSLAPLWVALRDRKWNAIACPYRDVSSLSSLEVELADRRSALRNVGGFAVTAVPLSQGASAALGASRNSPDVAIVHVQGIPSPLFDVCARIVAEMATSAQLDPARPFQTLQLTNIVAPRPADLLTAIERNLLLADGITTLRVGPGGVLEIERLISTYQLDATGADSEAYLDATTWYTVDRLRYDLDARLRQRFPRHKLADDGTKFAEGQPVCTPQIARDEVVALYAEWESLGLVEDADTFARNLIVERDPQVRTRLNMRLPPNLVNPLILLASQIQFRL